jgi:hypothetical protein
VELSPTRDVCPRLLTQKLGYLPPTYEAIVDSLLL